MNKFFITSFLIISILCSFALPFSVQASVLPNFGGMNAFEMLCTCSGSFWIWLTPLYFAGIMMAGPLDYYPGLIEFSNYFPVTSGWDLGTYITGASLCYIPIGTGCITIPSYGMIGPITGTSI
jgi:hypothetical protein